MNLHENPKLFKNAVRYTAQQKGLQDIYIEKDYWITHALFSIFKSEIKDEVVFKGGTALSKAYKLIDRFSEDIDLFVLRKENDSNSKMRTKLKKISSLVAEYIPEIDAPNLTNKKGMIRKTVHNYEKSFKGDYGQILDAIIIEATWLGDSRPYLSKIVSSYIYDMFLETNKIYLINEYNLNPFDVLVLDLNRTFCEKLMSIVRFSYTKDFIYDLKNKVRHIYDLHMLLKEPSVKAFFNSSDIFDTMLKKVAKDDVKSFKSNNKWLENHPKDAVIFTDTKNVWQQIEKVYFNEFKNIVFGYLPSSLEILKTLSLISNRLKSTKWNIVI